MMDLDDVLKQIGQFGRHQIYTYVLIALAIFLSGITGVLYAFSAGQVTYRCYVPDCDGDRPSAPWAPVWLNHSVPMEGGKPSACLRYARNESVPAAPTCPAEMFTNTTERCHSWVYDGKEYTIASEYNLTSCEDKDWMLALVGTINSVGQFAGLPIVGYVSDRFGRKIALVGSLVVAGVLGVARSFSPNYTTFIILEFFGNMVGGSILFGAAFILGIELVGPDKRLLGAIIINGLDAVGEVILGLLAWWLRDWVVLLQVIHAPALLFVFYYWLLPESVRWLQAKGRVEEAKEIIKKVAKTNKTEISEETLEKFATTQEKAEEEVPVGEVAKQVLKSRVLLLRLLNACYCWMVNTCVYFGLSLNSVSIADDQYVAFILVCLIEIPGYVLTYFFLASRMGRKISLCSTLIASGVACIAYIFINQDMVWLRLVLYLFGKFSITIAFTTVYVFTAELFPTQLRHSLLGVCSMIGRIGSFLAPQTPLLAKYFESLPLILFGALSLSSGLLALFFPETKDTVLPDTVKEAEDIGKNRSQPPSRSSVTAGAGDAS